MESGFSRALLVSEYIGEQNPSAGASQTIWSFDNGSVFGSVNIIMS
jgi:hypothetical protein